MPNCKCGHPGHKHYERRETWRECVMCRCRRYRPNCYRSKVEENNVPVPVNNWFLRRRRK